MSQPDAVRDMLRFWLEHGAFQLRIDLSGPCNHVGSQLSRGYLDLRGDVGQNALSYMGRHSEGMDFPIALLHGDAGDSLATSSVRGMVYCSGDVGDDCGKGMTGGTVVVGGHPGNRFGVDMDDRTHPAVLIAYCSLNGYLPEGDIRNGLVFLLNRDTDRGPELFRFRDGQKETLEPTLDPRMLYSIVREYVAEWRQARGGVVLEEWT